MEMSTQADLHRMIGALSQDSYVSGFDPNHQSMEEDPLVWRTPLTSLRPVSSRNADKIKTPVLKDFDIPQSSQRSPDYELVYVSHEAWEQLQEWSKLATELPLGPVVFNAQFSHRITAANEWLSSQTMDAVMYLFREKTSLRRWKPEGVGFISYAIVIEIKSQHQRWKLDKKKFELTELLMLYGKGELPSHGRTDKVWDVDIKRIYVPLNVNGNHWISLCINFGERRIEVFDCAGLKRYKEVDAFAVMIPRIVKEVQPPQKKKILNVAPYSVTYVPVANDLNKSVCDCGVYALKFIECHVLGLDISLINDGNIQEARHKIATDLLQAATDEVLVYRMSMYKAPTFETPSEVVDIS